MSTQTATTPPTVENPTALKLGGVPRYYTVAGLMDDGLYYPINMKWQKWYPMFTKEADAMEVMRQAKSQGINAAVFAFNTYDFSIVEEQQ